MSLLDALLLESYGLNVWIAIRSDGIKGSGTLSDPYDGSTATKFDALMRDIAAQTKTTVGVRVNLGPGIFQTQGYYDGIDASVSWRPSARMKIVGSGIDVTTLKLASAAPEDAQAFAVGHVLGNNTAQVDFFEISDLTIDCNLEGQTHDIAAGAIRIKAKKSHRLWSANHAARAGQLLRGPLLEMENVHRRRPKQPGGRGHSLRCL